MSHASEEILKFTDVNVHCITSLLTAFNLSEEIMSFFLLFFNAASVPLSPHLNSLSLSKTQTPESGINFFSGATHESHFPFSYFNELAKYASYYSCVCASLIEINVNCIVF